MKRSPLLILLTALLAALVLICARAWLMVPSHDEVRTLIANALRDNFRDTIALNANPSFSLFPKAEFYLTSPKLISDRGVTIQAEMIKFGMSFADLLRGDYHISSVVIETADIALPTEYAPQSQIEAEAVLKSFITFFEHRATQNSKTQIDQVIIRSSRVHVGPHDAALNLAITNAIITQDGLGGFAIDLSAAQKDRAFDAHLSVAPPDHEAQHGRITHFSYRDDVTQFSGDGTIAFNPNTQFIGSVNFQSDNINTITNNLLHYNLFEFKARTTLDASARMSLSAMTLSDMHCTIGNARLKGNIMADFARKIPRITGTLAATEMDLSELADHIRDTRSGLGKWNGERFSVDLIPDIDADLRLSSDIVTVHDVVIKSVALSALLQERKLEFALVSADLFDGSLSGKVGFARQTPEGLHSAYSNLTFSQIDLERVLVAVIDSKRASGTGSGQINLKAEGHSAAELVADMSGAVEFETAHTSFAGFNLSNFLHRVEQKPIGAGLALKGGSTDFDTVAITLAVVKGVGTFKRANLTHLPDLRIKLDGQINFAEQSLSISGNATSTSAQDLNQTINLPFVLKGPFDNPNFIPDFVNLSKQSGPVAP